MSACSASSSSRPTRAIVRAAGLLLAATACIGMAACGDRGGAGRGASAAAEPLAVSFGSVERRTVPRSVEITGTLFGTEEATISAKVPGRVEAIVRDVGDQVVAGGELARIEQSEYALALEQKRTAVLESLAALGLSELPPADFDPAEVPTVVKARLQAENAESRHRRAEQLWKQVPPLISEQDYADLRTAWDVARSDAEVALLTARATLAEARSREADRALAAQRLEDAVVRAPLPGEVAGASVALAGAAPASPLTFAVAARLASAGEYVATGSPMFRVVAADPIKFRGEAPERLVDRIRVGQQATLRVEAFADDFPGRVARINPQVNPRSRTFQVEIEVPNPDGRLRPGSFGRAAVVIAEDRDVPFVPSSALTTFAGVTKVFSVRDGKAVEHRVEAGRRVEGLVEAVGLPPEVEEVITSGLQRLATGVPVRALPVTSPAAAAVDEREVRSTAGGPS